MNSQILTNLVQKLHINFKRSIPIMMQTEAAECGLASLAMICNYFKLNTDLLSLRQRFGISTNGANLEQIIDIATLLNLKTRPLSLDLHELKELRTPCILHWDLNHFVVLISIKGNKVTIHDPAFGKRILSIRETSDHFTGVALELWPTSEFKPETRRSRLQLITLLRNIDGLKGFLIKLLFLSVVVEAINLLLPVGTQLVMDHVIIAEDHGLLALICIGLLLFILLKTVISFFRSWIIIVTNALINVQWGSSLFSHLMRLPLDYFEKRKLGDVQSRFSSLDIVRKTFTTNLITGVMDIIMTIMVFFMMFLYGNWLVWVVLGFTIIYTIMRLATYNYYRQSSEEFIIKHAKESSHFMESLYGVNTIKALGLAEKRTSYWLNLKIDAINAEVKINKFDMFFGGASSLIAAIDQVVILWIGATLVIEHQMTLGMFVAFSAYRDQFSDRTIKLVNMFLELRMLTLHSERIADIALTNAEPQTEPLQILKEGEQVQLEVKDLTFQYDKLSRPIFNNLNMTVLPGEHLAITGPSGIGKTTLLKIMAGLLAPSSGSILINGLNIHQIGIDNYRKYIACVLQDDKLFSGSIEENIAGFDNNIDRNYVVECAKLTNIHDEIMSMPMAYQTLIGELGSNLSGGQKQRLLIARALYIKPRILFLDEATSHLDTINEEQINQAINKQNITRVIIAHRPSTIASADRIMTI